MDRFKKVKVIGNVIGFNMYTFGEKETYNVQFPDMTVAELESYQFEDADAYHTNGKPLCLRNVLARLRGLPEHDRKVWMDEIMHEFANDYGVEQERRYKAVLPNLYEEENVLHFSQEDEVWYFNHDFNDNVSVDKDSRYHTRKELEDAGFGWVFDCEGVEVQEVE
ncbi:DUF1642 domain-containing protein [Streptococcus intermedius]